MPLRRGHDGGAAQPSEAGAGPWRTAPSTLADRALCPGREHAERPRPDCGCAAVGAGSSAAGSRDDSGATRQPARRLATREPELRTQLYLRRKAEEAASWERQCTALQGALHDYSATLSSVPRRGSAVVLTARSPGAPVVDEAPGSRSPLFSGRERWFTGADLPLCRRRPKSPWTGLWSAAARSSPCPGSLAARIRVRRRRYASALRPPAARLPHVPASPPARTYVMPARSVPAAHGEPLQLGASVARQPPLITVRPPTPGTPTLSSVGQELSRTLSHSLQRAGIE